MPAAGPDSGAPRYSTCPDVGRIKPPTIRSNVDLPDPERPSRPRISPSRRTRLTPASTGNGSPDGLAKAMKILSSSMIGGEEPSPTGALSIKPRAPLRIGIERAPQQAVHGNDKHGHHNDTERNAGIVACRGHFRNVGSEAGGAQPDVPPARPLGDDACIPRAAGGGDGAGDVIREDARQYHLPPPAAGTDPKALCRFPQVGGKCAGSRNYVEQYVPLRPEDHQRAEPDLPR